MSPGAVDHVALFSTPVVAADLDGAEAINAELRTSAEIVAVVGGHTFAVEEALLDRIARFIHDRDRARRP